MSDAFATGHHERVERGIGAVQSHLEAEFPGHVVRGLKRDQRDFDRGIRTFEVRKDSAEYILQVVDEVLDLDAEGVRGHLQRFRVAAALHQAGSGNAVVVTTDKIHVEPTSP